MSKELDQSNTGKEKLFTTKKRKRTANKSTKATNKKNTSTKRDEENREQKIDNEKNEMMQEETGNRGTNKEGINESAGNLCLEANELARELDHARNDEDLSEDNLIESAIQKLKSDDPDSVLKELYELTNQLSVADESIAENSNCSQLIKVLLNIFDKFNSSELSIQSLLAINFLLDIHPYFCNTIIKYEGVSKIALLTQNVEYIDLAETAIKTIEKISNENSLVLLENDCFNSILLFVDFFEDNVKKYVITSCLNMTRYIRRYETLQKFILPAIPSLTSLTKLYGNTDLQKSILDKAIICFYNIFAAVKNYNFSQNDKKIFETIVHNGLIDNLIEILITFFKMLNENTSNSNNQSKNNSVISMETFKNILKIFQLLSEQSAKISNILINMNILEMIQSIFIEELEISSLNANSIVKGRVATSHHSIFNELFPFLKSLFPNISNENKDKDDELRLITDNSSHVYLFFSEKIIPLLIRNFINISSSNISLKALKLINVYCIFSKSENLEKYVNPVKLSNIMSKMLDSKDMSYILEVFDIIETIMSKTPQVFLVELIREGVLGNIKEIISIQKDDVFFPTDISFIIRIIEKYQSIMPQSPQSEVKKTTQMEVDVVEKEESESQSEKTNEDKLLTIIQIIAKQLSEKYFNEEFTAEIFKSLNILNSKNNPNIIINSLFTLSSKIKLASKDYLDKNLLDEFFTLLLDDVKVTFYEIEKSQIIINFVNYIDENFKINITQKKNIQNTKYERDIVDKLKTIFLLLDYKTEKIKQFLLLLQYCVSSMNCFKVCLYEYSTYKNASHLFLSAYKNQMQKYKVNFIYAVNQDILEEYGIDPNYQELHLYYSNDQNKKIVEIDHSETFVNLQEAILKRQYKGVPLDKSRSQMSSNFCNEEEILNTVTNRKGSEDFENTERLLTQLLERKQSSLVIEEENVNSNLLPLALRNQNTTPSKRIKYNVNFNIEMADKKLFINKNWNFNDAIKEIKNNFKKKDWTEFLSDIKIKFEIVVKDDLIEIGRERKSSMNGCPIQLKLKLEDSNHDIITQHLQENYVEEILFIKFYNEKIINNPALYSVTRASPFIYLICLFELSINQYGNLFNCSEKLNEILLENSKISSLLIKQVRDPYAISANSVPSWCKELSFNYPFITSFNSRYLFFKTCTFDVKRSMTNLYVYIKNFMGETITEDKTLANNRRRKFTVDRQNVIHSTEKLMKELGNYTGYLEFEYMLETGSGIGPTQEYYSLFSKELMNVKKLWYKTTDQTLFPAPYVTKEIGFEENEKLFSLLGFVVARSLYDDRLIDIPFNCLFWDLVLERPVSYSKICKIDKDLGLVFNDFIKLINKKTELLNDSKEVDGEDRKHYNDFLNDKLLYNKTKIEDIGINFVIPGYHHIELKENGYDEILNAYNLEEYVNLVFDSLCFEGIKDSITAFKKGFNIVFPVTSLSCFTSQELSDILCGSQIELWDFDTLFDSIVPNHGYDKNSPVFKYLIDFMLNLENKDRKKFLSFVTGSPRLPLGGLTNLSPKLTIVKKNPDKQNDSADNYLPTVMTCQNYLKIPDYSSYEVFKNRLNMAMNEGGNSFDLS